MLKIKDINRYSYTLSFMQEFLESVKKENFNFDEFMKIMYGDIEKFKEGYLKDMEKDFESICYYLGNYEKITDLVEKIEQ